MPRLALSGIVVLSSLFAGVGCSSGVAEVATPKSDVAPLPTAAATARGRAGKPSPCDVASLLVAKAGELREQGYLARAERALDDAEARCPDKASDLVEPVRKQVRAARSVRDDETPAGVLSEAPKSSEGAGGERRRHERWLAALERDAGAKTTLSAPDPSASLGFAWAQDGSRAAVIRGAELSIYDADLRTEEGRYSVRRGTHDLVWLPSGKALVVGHRESHSYRVLDLEKKRLGEEIDLGKEVSELSVSRDGKTLVLESYGLVFWDLAAKKRIGEVTGAAPVTGVAWSPSGDRVAVGTADGAVRVLTFPALEDVAFIAGLDESVEPAFLSDKRLFVVSGDRAGSYDPATGKKLGKQLRNAGCTGGLLGERGVLWTCTAQLDADDAITGKRTHLYTPPELSHAPGFTALRVAPDGGSVWYLLEGQQRFVDARTGKVIAPVDAPTFYGMHIRPGSKRLAAIGSAETTLWTSDLGSDRRAVIRPNGPDLPCSRMGVNGLGAPVFADVETRGAELPAEGQIALRGVALDAPKAPPTWLASCPRALTQDAGRVAFYGKDELRVVRTSDWSTEAAIPLDARIHESWKLTLDGTRAVVWGRAGLRVVEVATSRVLAEWKVAVDWRMGVQLSPSGKRVFVPVGVQGSLHEVGREAPTAVPFSGGAVAFAGDDVLVEAATDAVRISDLATGKVLRVAGPKGGMWMNVSPDGKRAVVTGGNEGWLVDLTDGGAPPVRVDELAATKQVVFLPAAGAFAVFEPVTGVAWLRSLSSGKPLGQLRRVGFKGAVYLSATGNVEILGEGAGDLRCVREPSVLPLEDCQDRYLEKGLFARTMAGRGCTSEDVGSVCD